FVWFRFLFFLASREGVRRDSSFIRSPAGISKGEEEAVFEESWGSKDVLAFLFGEDCWERLGMV
ncbi:hypothetical protein A3SI_18337, partial [Nitritalea halalkaliphila LW7]